MQPNTQGERANGRGPARAEEDRGTGQKTSGSRQVGVSSHTLPPIPTADGQMEGKRTQLSITDGTLLIARGV